MIFHQTPLAGAHLIELERLEDERGFFARSWCRQEFGARGLAGELAQCNVSFNRQRGTFRGLHYQRPPHAEAKLVRCTRGAIYDLIVDLRRSSATFGLWHGVELSADNHRLLFVPAGVAHGFLTLADDSEVFYQMSHAHEPAAAAGVRWDDPALGITLPEPVRVISARDESFPDLAHAVSLAVAAGH